MDNPNEVFDVVDHQDRVVGQATRGEVHARGLCHRSIHILVFNSKGELFLQKRSEQKDENPGYWDTSAAGHVNTGEGYLECAHRELQEELGIAADLKPFFRITACKETFWEHVRIYTCVTEQPISINKDEISQGCFWTVDEIKRAFQNEKDLFTSTFKMIFEQYVNRLT